jgi:hypothetical protein
MTNSEQEKQKPTGKKPETEQPKPREPRTAAEVWIEEAQIVEDNS